MSDLDIAGIRAAALGEIGHGMELTPGVAIALCDRITELEMLCAQRGDTILMLSMDRAAYASRAAELERINTQLAEALSAERKVKEPTNV